MYNTPKETYRNSLITIFKCFQIGNDVENSHLYLKHSYAIGLKRSRKDLLTVSLQHFSFLVNKTNFVQCTSLTFCHRRPKNFLNPNIWVIFISKEMEKEFKRKEKKEMVMIRYLTSPVAKLFRRMSDKTFLIDRKIAHLRKQCVVLGFTDF